MRVLIDGVGTADVSNTSVDHATSIDPITVERVEVLRGPAVLLLRQSGDRRRGQRDRQAHSDPHAGRGSAPRCLCRCRPVPAIHAPARPRLMRGLAPNLVFHVDGSWRDTGNMDIGGFQLSPELRAELLEEAVEKDADGEPDEAAEFREAAAQRGTVPNSDMPQLDGQCRARPDSGRKHLWRCGGLV